MQFLLEKVDFHYHVSSLEGRFLVPSCSFSSLDDELLLRSSPAVAPASFCTTMGLGYLCWSEMIFLGGSSLKRESANHGGRIQEILWTVYVTFADILLFFFGWGDTDQLCNETVCLKRMWPIVNLQWWSDKKYSPCMALGKIMMASQYDP